eukprot:4419840-Heterocapsa_arctica.AAC.1
MRLCLAPGLREERGRRRRRGCLPVFLASKCKETINWQVISCIESHVDLTGHRVSEGEWGADLGEDRADNRVSEGEWGARAASKRARPDTEQQP